MNHVNRHSPNFARRQNYRGIHNSKSSVELLRSVGSADPTEVDSRVKMPTGIFLEDDEERQTA